jgi:transposase
MGKTIPKKIGRPAYVPVDSDKAKIRLMVVAGLTAKQISEVIGIGKTTLYEHYKRELQTAAREANSAVVGNLYALTKKHPAAAIFWCKTRLGWKEKELETASAESTTINIYPEAKPARYESDADGKKRVA